MLFRWLNTLRCRLAHTAVERNWPKSYAIAQRIAPDVTSLIHHSPRRPPPLRVPPHSHLIYHQSTVDALSARNSLETIAAQIPPEDEVVFLDVGGTLDASVLAPFARHAWRSYMACAAEHPEQRSYTYGLNLTVPALKAPRFTVWRTDYVYPPGFDAANKRHLARVPFAAPYAVLVGLPEVDAKFVRQHWDKVVGHYDVAFWAARAKRVSLYESQDPALLAMERALWDRIGGLNHELWGYGWQFAEFAARLRTTVGDAQLAYFDGPPPLHQTHEGSQMHQPAERAAEAQAGIDRFARFLGGKSGYWVYRLKWMLPPKPPE